MAPTPLQQLNEHGQSVWVDFLSRPFIENGELAELVEAGVHGVTSNPTIFQSAIAEGDAYDEQLREVLQTETEPKEIFLALAVRDIQAACDVLAPVHDSGADGWVVKLRPEQVVEIAFDGVQTSSRYPGGMALRFARVLRYRDDKSPHEADTVDTVRAFHERE